MPRPTDDTEQVSKAPVVSTPPSPADRPDVGILPGDLGADIEQPGGREIGPDVQPQGPVTEDPRTPGVVPDIA
jgi:hypothetical protein